MSKTQRNERQDDTNTMRRGNPHAKRAIVRMLATFALAGVMTAGARAEQASAPNAPRVNVNTATEQQLQLLPGVGPKLASAIHDAAETGAAECDHKCQFKTLGDLDKVKGVGPAKLKAMEPYVVFEGETTATVKIKIAKAAKEPKG